MARGDRRARSGGRRDARQRCVDARRAARRARDATTTPRSATPTRAINAYKRLLEADPSSPTTIRRAGAALARLYEEGQNWRELRAITRQQAEWAEDAGERHALLARVAQLDEEKLDDRDAAIATWRDVLADQPNDASALHALERLYQARAQLARADRYPAPQGRSSPRATGGSELLARIAEIHEQKLGENDEAIAAWLEVIDRDSEDVRALDSSRGFIARANATPICSTSTSAKSCSTTVPRRPICTIAVARLLGGPLARPVEALDRWASILRERPAARDGARSGRGGARTIVDLRVAAADILRPVYAATGQEERLAQLSLLQAEWTDDIATKLRALLEVVRIREWSLGDKAGAFEIQLRALRHAATEPELPHVVAETERLAGELGREADLDRRVSRGRARRARRRDPAPPLPRHRRPRARRASRSRARARVLPEGARQHARGSPRARPRSRASIARRTTTRSSPRSCCARPTSRADVNDKVGELVEAAGIYAALEAPRRRDR